jgi:hypothetical protein
MTILMLSLLLMNYVIIQTVTVSIFLKIGYVKKIDINTLQYINIKIKDIH